ncbi:uncharacterized protein EDB91DRAFT_1082830 [Suillus paluster]|uniref:uncharacterized protein n=1 Tax=Suillus paluster TaxID=48578 RepID=UPI001B86CC58|nr:uncharacterized protein EDB91DRAFT_1082830 [Suillus paluster]KAG1738453.1 hypothetical protein EDB91DRAFT_1082830 [Suillus paluster]
MRLPLQNTLRSSLSMNTLLVSFLPASAMADECFLHHYLGVYYNIPACSKKTPWNPPFYCVTRGNVVGVLPSWEHTLNAVLGICNANYEEVDTITIGEEKVRLAIEKGEVEIVNNY